MSTSDVVGLLSLLVAFGVAVAGASAYVQRTNRTVATDPASVFDPPMVESALVSELRGQSVKQDRRIQDLEDELERERRDRAEDNRRHQAELDSLRELIAKLRTEVEVTRIQIGMKGQSR